MLTIWTVPLQLFRALYTLVRALPVFEFHRKQKRRTGRSELKIGCRLSTKEADLDAMAGNSGNLEAEMDNDKNEIGLGRRYWLMLHNVC